VVLVLLVVVVGGWLPFVETTQRETQNLLLFGNISSPFFLCVPQSFGGLSFVLAAFWRAVV